MKSIDALRREVSKLMNDYSRFCRCTMLLLEGDSPPEDGIVCPHCNKIRNGLHTIIEVIAEVVDRDGNVIPWPPEGETPCK
jgi:hypothetical protein